MNVETEIWVGILGNNHYQYFTIFLLYFTISYNKFIEINALIADWKDTNWKIVKTDQIILEIRKKLIHLLR